MTAALRACAVAIATLAGIARAHAADAAANAAAGVGAGARVESSCRDGELQGPYQLRDAKGQLRVAGAFNAGKRTGSFIFWTERGVRSAHVPYDEDRRNGTVAMWYEANPGAEPPRRFESVWRRGSREGPTRSWYHDGRRRSEVEYAAGKIVAATAWSDAGERLGDAAARAVAERDARDMDAAYEALDTLIREHVPHCD